jgi:hypothetical protein
MSTGNPARSSGPNVKLTDEELEKAKAACKSREALELAMATVGYLSADGVTGICPKCQKELPLGSKLKLHESGMYKHFGSEGCSGDAISVMMALEPTPGVKVNFINAVKFLNGLPTTVEIKRPDKLPELGARSFTAVVDKDVYKGILLYGRKTGGVDAAIEFYGQWHISPDAVRESGAVYIKDPRDFAKNILAKPDWGAERLIRAGLFVETDRGPRCLIDDSFPVVEPHLHPSTGLPVYLQFRASNKQYQKYLEHKRGEREYKGSQKFLSLRGAPREAQLGSGLPRIAKLPAGSIIYIVEGFKDMLAARTLGTEAYGIPGVDFRPPAGVCKLLADKRVRVALDGDEAGEKHFQALINYLKDNGVNDVERHEVKQGLDITDSLVKRYASKGCNCPACQKFREEHPE